MLRLGADGERAAMRLNDLAGDVEAESQPGDGWIDIRGSVIAVEYLL